ncbi:MAG: DNA repair exonuclease [Euryarchaeota archaeon]|nr:DNA repair exonuclease [Euryarchaeota archaeon]
MLFAHIADTHLGYRQYNLDEREEDFYAVFDEAVDRIIEAGCDFVVHSGDLFDEPRPHVKALVRVREALERLADAGIKFYCIAGNHDLLMRRGAVPPQRLYREVEFLTPAKPVRNHGGVFIAGLPYFSKIHRRVLREKLEWLGREAAGHEVSILLLHQGVRKYFTLEYELDLQDLPESFSYYAMGHIHRRIVDRFGRGVLAYPGSTEVWRGDELAEYERNGKGFFVVDTEDISPSSIEWVRLRKVRPFRRLVLSSPAEVLEAAGKLCDGRPVLRVEVRAGQEAFQRVYRDIMAHLSPKALYVDVKKLVPEEEGSRRVESGSISVEALILESMENHTEEEKALAVELFRRLASGEVDSALAAAEEFFERLNSRERGDAPPGGARRQVSLEGFR